MKYYRPAYYEFLSVCNGQRLPFILLEMNTGMLFYRNCSSIFSHQYLLLSIPTPDFYLQYILSTPPTFRIVFPGINIERMQSRIWERSAVKYCHHLNSFSLWEKLVSRLRNENITCHLLHPTYPRLRRMISFDNWMKSVDLKSFSRSCTIFPKRQPY